MPGEAPNFKRFEDEGAWTINARADYSFTNTLPNHTTILTGRPVLETGWDAERAVSQLDEQHDTASRHDVASARIYTERVRCGA